MLKTIKNIIGHLKGFDICPHCQNTFWRNHTINFWYTNNHKIMICNQCIIKPEKLDYYKIILFFKKREPEKILDLQLYEAIKILNKTGYKASTFYGIN